MTTERDQFPEHFTFSQRNGYEALPEPMKLKQLSPDLRRELSYAVCKFLSDIGPTEQTGLEAYYGQSQDRNRRESLIRENFIKCVLKRFLKTTESKIETDFDLDSPSKYFEQYLTEESFNRVLDLLEIMFSEMENTYSQTGCRFVFIEEIKSLLDKHASAYWLDISQHPCKFVARTSREEGEAIQQAIEIIHQGGMNGAVAHLRKAAKSINVGEHADSIRESIHAVESVARTIDLDASKTLGPALSSLRKHRLLQHEALTKAFQQLYGYTCDEQGIRHALLDKSAADVGLEEAIFMFGACASFAGYLTQKHRQAQAKGGSRP